MKKLTDITGYTTRRSELYDSLYEYVGVLLFVEFPTTIIYADKAGNPIVKEWVDCSDDGTTDRYYFYKTSKSLLKKFINGTVSHLDFILRSNCDELYILDMQNSALAVSGCIPKVNLPDEYKPSEDSFLNIRDAVDINGINDFVDLNNNNVSTQEKNKIGNQKKARLSHRKTASVPSDTDRRRHHTETSSILGVRQAVRQPNQVVARSVQATPIAEVKLTIQENTSQNGRNNTIGTKAIKAAQSRQSSEQFGAVIQRGNNGAFGKGKRRS